MNTCTVFTILLIGVIGAQAFPPLPVARDFLQIMKVSSSSVLRNGSLNGVVEHARCVRNAFALSAEDEGYVDLWAGQNVRLNTIMKEFEKCESLPSDEVDEGGHAAVILFIDAARESCPIGEDPVLFTITTPSIELIKCIRNAYTTASEDEENHISLFWIGPNVNVGRYITRYEQCDQLDNASQVRRCKVRFFYFANEILSRFINDVDQIGESEAALRILRRGRDLCPDSSEPPYAISTQNIFGDNLPNGIKKLMQNIPKEKGE